MFDMLTEDDVLKGTSLDETFPHVPGGDLSGLGGADGYGWYKMKAFWRAYRPWLEARGFHLFERRSDDLDRDSGYIFPPPTQCSTALPHGIYADVELLTSTQITPPPQFEPARDTHMRDVMIKLVKKGSDEHHIYEDLLHCSKLSGKDFQGVLPPVAILDSQHDFSFVVMPRWGDYNPIEVLDTVGGIFTLMRCLLKGLAFLHSRRIIHRDIDFHNIMVNYYTFGIYREKFIHALGEHRRGPHVLYCLMDFDRSLKFPTDAPFDACRLPPEASLVSATPFQPPDLSLGEPDYDPFAYDVGCLGNIFRATYADLVPIIPMLASLFDRMTTHVISERFRAADALALFEDATRHLPGDVLDGKIELAPDWDYTDDPSLYWAKVPPDFCATTWVYRTPPPSLVRRLLNVIVSYRVGWKIVAFLRRVLHV